MDTYKIQPFTVGNIDALRKISIDTFTATYASFNTPENMELYVSTYFNEAQLQAELVDNGNHFFGIFVQGDVAGYVKLRTKENLVELAGRRHIELERIYVYRQYQGMHFGAALIRFCQEFSAQQGFEVLWLGVWQKNAKAIAFYKNSGFEIFGEHVFTLGTDAQTDWLMKKELNPK